MHSGAEGWLLLPTVLVHQGATVAITKRTCQPAYGVATTSPCNCCLINSYARLTPTNDVLWSITNHESSLGFMRDWLQRPFRRPSSHLLNASAIRPLPLSLSSGVESSTYEIQPRGLNCSQIYCCCCCCIDCEQAPYHNMFNGAPWDLHAILGLSFRVQY
jgi:hypothetical protein